MLVGWRPHRMTADGSNRSPDFRSRDIEQRIVAGLDHQRIGRGPDSWTASVTAVHIDGSTIWIQLAKGDGGDESVVVRMREDTAASDVLAALTRVPREVPRSPFVVVVGPLAH
jgi:hypothetical protein